MASLSQDPASSETAGFGFVIDLAAPSQDVLLSSLLALSHLPTEVLFLTPGDRELPVSAHPAWTRVPLPDPARGPFPDAAIGDFLLSAASPWIVFPESPAPLPPDSLGRLARLLQDARPTDGYLRTDPESTGGVLPSLTILRRGAALELCLFDEPALLRNASKARLRLRELGWRDAAYPSEAAGEPFLPLRFAWQDYRLTVITVLIGRRTCFPDWLNWIRTEKFPTETRLHLVDNSADRDFGALLRNAAATLLAEGRFSGLTLLRGPGPYLEGPRLNIRRCLNFAHALNLTLPSVMGDLALTVDCDTIPEAGAVAHLLDAYTNRRHAGCRPGVVSGLCESATCRGHLTAARSRTAWRDMPRVDEIPHGELVEAGFAGNGCCLMPVPAMREALPMRAELLPGGGIAGPDHVLCRALRERGYSVWLHGSVRCRHLF
jgi:hypothetical protein